MGQVFFLFFFSHLTGLFFLFLFPKWQNHFSVDSVSVKVLSLRIVNSLVKIILVAPRQLPWIIVWKQKYHDHLEEIPCYPCIWSGWLILLQGLKWPNAGQISLFGVKWLPWARSMLDICIWPRVQRWTLPCWKVSTLNKLSWFFF